MKLISVGSHSTAFKVVHTQESDETMTVTWAQKPIHFQSDSVIQCAAGEYHAPQRHAQEEEQSPMLCIHMQSFSIHEALALVPDKADGIDVHCYLRTNSARFYSYEITCGLEEMHLMGVVNLYLNSNNTPSADSLYLFLMKPDGSYDTAGKKGPSKKTDLINTPFFVAPEAKYRVGFMARADIWSLDITTAFGMYGHTTMRDWLRKCWHLNCRSSQVPKTLRTFIKTCLRSNSNKCVSIEDFKCVEFYKAIY
ncbi:hypothetical protein TcWFU_003745 [Taenia crassiceps]|uniref:Protein kinase domain-containing protein n=1 Tax=Taenia crassiceps TaxID=6207 RepID=A0ABR4Q360_9CEST